MTVFHIGADAGAGSRVLEVTFLALHKPTLLFLTFSWPILLFLAQNCDRAILRCVLIELEETLDRERGRAREIKSRMSHRAYL